MLMHRCRCGALIPIDKAHCDKCAVHAEDNSKVYDTNIRDKRSTRFHHSKEWKRLRDLKMGAEHGLCELCGEPATEVHHIVSIRDDWSKRLVYSNLQALCHSCHMRITREQERRKKLVSMGYGGRKK